VVETGAPANAAAMGTQKTRGYWFQGAEASVVAKGLATDA
jgi:hypothetical protein